MKLQIIDSKNLAISSEYLMSIIFDLKFQKIVDYISILPH